MKVIMEASMCLAAPATHKPISGAFTAIHSMFLSIILMVSITASVPFNPKTTDNSINLSKWAGELIASANSGKVSSNETLLQTGKKVN